MFKIDFKSKTKDTLIYQINKNINETLKLS